MPKAPIKDTTHPKRISIHSGLRSRNTVKLDFFNRIEFDTVKADMSSREGDK